MPRRRTAAKSQLTHVDSAGKLKMVDVGDKPVSQRTAIAEASVRVSAELAKAIRANSLKKGDVLSVAQLAGVMAAKKTGELIPLCHPLMLQKIDVSLHLRGSHVVIRSEVKTEGQTGVEMEALTAAAVAALAVIDMGKSIDRSMVIESVRLLSKTGGTKGDYAADKRSGRSLRSGARFQTRTC